MESSSSGPKVVEIPNFVRFNITHNCVFRWTNTNPYNYVCNEVKEQDKLVMFADYCFNKTHQLNLSLFKPHNPKNMKLPLIVFLQGLGFCIGSREWPHIRATCVRLASELGAVVVCPDHRLAPEHRLPAAFEDVLDAIGWLKSGTWPRDDVDLSRVFVVGESSGGNLAHHLAVWFGQSFNRDRIYPVQIRGYVLLGPFFGGKTLLASEMTSEPKDSLHIQVIKNFWKLALPWDSRTMKEANRDHEFANPFGENCAKLGQIVDPIMVIVGGNELLKDRTLHYANTLKEELGKNVVCYEIEEQEHEFFAVNPNSDAAKEVFEYLRRFMITI